MTHISECLDRRAVAILADGLDAAGAYERNILSAAGELVAAGMGDYVYVTQWASGTTCWRHIASRGELSVLVDTYGRIDR